ncbi:RIKEN cDNA 1700010H22 [Mus musculus]|uniref:Uncharacterized protein n=1 Tax=Mus musculus TaxID=10090 RepID=Q9DAH8_MOUSE|nr:RIKEN cDNA 1700010H22 [Mus musculus]BAB24260.1 unnamed protein product [Mus musculus]
MFPCPWKEEEWSPFCSSRRKYLRSQHRCGTHSHQFCCACPSSWCKFRAHEVYVLGRHWDPYSSMSVFTNTDQVLMGDSLPSNFFKFFTLQQIKRKNLFLPLMLKRLLCKKRSLLFSKERPKGCGF